MPLRLIFMGTPDFAVPTLLELVAHGHEVVAVYTRAPKPGGRRGLQLQPTPVEQEARRLKIPVLTPTTLSGRGGAATCRVGEIVLRIFARQILNVADDDAGEVGPNVDVLVDHLGRVDRPRVAEVRHDESDLRVIDRHVVDIQGVRVLQLRIG